MEKMTDKTSEKNIQYQIYEPFNMTLLNMSICENTDITVYIPFTLEGEDLELYQDLLDSGYNIFNKNDKFYTDICTPFTSADGTDIPLSARQKYIYGQYSNLCQENCQLLDYSPDTKLISCSCKTTDEGIQPTEENKFNPKTLYKSFYDILKYSNYKVLKCFDLVFKKKTFTINNKGSVMVLVYFALYLSFLIAFCIKGISTLKNICSNFQGNLTMNSNGMKSKDQIVPNINEKNMMNKNENTQNKKKHKRRKSKIKSYPPKKRLTYANLNNQNNNDIIINNLVNNINNINNVINTKNNKENRTRKRKRKTLKTTKINDFQLKNNLKKALETKNNMNSKDNNENKIIINDHSNDNNYNINSNKDILIYANKFEDIDKTEEKNNTIYIEELSNYELNNLEYEDSIKLDKRTFLQIYWSILRREHLILFTFFSRNDYNLLTVKFARFIFLVCTDMALNVFFFSDDSMNKIFLSYGKYDFVQKIPQFVYSVIVSQLLELLLCFLSLTDKYIYQIKRLKYKSYTEVEKIFKIIKIKLIMFFIVTSSLFIFFWYLVSAFCSVYVNTQIIFIKDSIFSFITGLLYPFILYLIPSTLRIICLKNKETSLKFLYALSDIIPFF